MLHYIIIASISLILTGTVILFPLALYGRYKQHRRIRRPARLGWY